MKKHKKLYKAGKLWITATVFTSIGITLTTNAKADTNQISNNQQILAQRNENTYNSANSLTQLEVQSSNDIQELQNQVNSAQQNVNEAQQEVNDAQNKVDNQQAIVENAKGNLQTAQNNLQTAGGSQSTVQERIVVNSDWVNAVKSYVAANQGTVQDIEDSSFSQELTNYGSSLMSQNQYISDPALQKITVSLTPDGVLDPSTELEVTRYTISLLNPIREKLGVNGYLITQQSLDDSTGIAKQYVQDNWTLFNHGTHDFQALFNNHQDGESLSDGYIYFNSEGTASLDSIHKAIYNSICDMLFNDAGSSWGHMTDLAGIRGWANGIYLGVQLDKNGQVHFNGNMVKTEGGRYGAQINSNGQFNWYTGHPDTSKRIPLTVNDSSEVQQLKKAVQDAQTQLDEATDELNNDNLVLNEANSKLSLAQQKLQQANDALAAAKQITIQSGFETENGNIYFRDNNGNRITGWLFSDSNRYYFDPTTRAAVTGLQNIDGYDYYFDPSTASAQTGWESINGHDYYFDPTNYYAVSGLVKIGDYTFYFDPSALNGLQNINGNIYYFDDYKMVTNQVLTLNSQNGIDGGTYTFDSNGIGTLQPAIKSGWQTQNGNQYYRDSYGNLVNGWQNIDGRWYYFNNNILVTNQILQLPGNSEMQAGLYDFNDYGNYITYSFDHDASDNYYYFGSDGRAVTGLQSIGAETYYFDPSTAIEYNGWKLINGDYYYFIPYAVDNLQNIGNTVYYFANNKLVTNKTLNLPSCNGIQGGTYRFDHNGHGKLLPQTGWKKVNNNWEYLDDNGTPVNDWQYIGSSWYYFENNIMVKNSEWYVPAKNGFAGGLYYFDENGHYLTNNWRKVSMNTTYYFGSDGRAVSGWQRIAKSWYYFNPTSYVMASDGLTFVPTDNNTKEGTYFFDQNGHYLINAWKEDTQGNNYFFGADGRAVNGVQTIGDVIYCFNNHQLVKNQWFNDHGAYYYLDNYGHAVNGWQLISGAWYYFNHNQMVADQVFNVPTTNGINGGTYYFNYGGHYLTNVWGQDQQHNDLYFGTDGRAVNGVQTIGDVIYCFNNHQLVKNQWFNDHGTYYYLDNYGHAVNGWKLINGAWYYFNKYQMVADQVFNVPTVNGINGGTYYFDHNGHYLTNIWKKDNNNIYHHFGFDGRERV